MNTVNNVTEKGLFGIQLRKYSQGKRYKCEIQYMPVTSNDGLIMDILLKASRGYILSTKSYETFKISPLHPELITMKLPGRVEPNDRYKLKIDMFKGDSLLTSIEHWLFTY
jgi:CTP:phosphocholine cytidylyltransferase-like protein